MQKKNKLMIALRNKMVREKLIYHEITVKVMINLVKYIFTIFNIFSIRIKKLERYVFSIIFHFPY